MQSEGRIELIVGPMFAGKTTELMRRVKREIHARRMCFVIKYAKDVRYSKDHVASHDKITLRAKAAVSALADVGDEWRSYEVIAVDEGQFFPDLIEFCQKVSDAGKIVFVSALDGDFLRKPFGQVCQLVPLCEAVTKLTAVCMMCHTREASFTRRTVANSQQELIGGADMYIATCRDCYNNPAPPSPARMVKVRDAIREIERATTNPSTSQGTPAAAHEAVNTTESARKQQPLRPQYLPDDSECGASSKDVSPPSALPYDATESELPQPKGVDVADGVDEPVLKKARCESPL